MSNKETMDILVNEYVELGSSEDTYKEYNEHLDYTEDKGW